MAFKEVEHEEVSYAQFSDIGDKFEGYYLRDSPGNYEKQDYYFRLPNGTVEVVSAGGGLKAQLEKAALSEGFLVRIKLMDLKETKHPNPKKVFKVWVDPAPAAKMPRASAAAPAAPRQAPPPHPPSEIEDPF